MKLKMLDMTFLSIETKAATDREMVGVGTRGGVVVRQTAFGERSRTATARQKDKEGFVSFGFI